MSETTFLENGPHEAPPIRFHLFQAGLSLICPGLGQLFQGRFLAFCGYLCLLIATFSFLLSPFFQLFFLLSIPLVLFSVLDAAVWKKGVVSPLKKHLVVLVWIVGPLAVLSLITLPKVSAAREAARRMQCQNHMKQILLAFHNYHSVHKSLPPAYIVDENGRPLHSWRVLILPYLETRAHYDEHYGGIRLEEPWDSEHNRQFHDRYPYYGIYQCPSWLWTLFPENRFPHLREQRTGISHYSVVIGPETPFPGTATTSFEEIGDLDNTILLVERLMPVCWMDPTREIAYETACQGINREIFGIGSVHSGEAGVGFASASARMFKQDEDLRPYLNIRKTKADREKKDDGIATESHNEINP